MLQSNPLIDLSNCVLIDSLHLYMIRKVNDHLFSFYDCKKGFSRIPANPLMIGGKKGSRKK